MRLLSLGKAILRFLFPEWQFVTLVKQRGFIASSARLPRNEAEEERAGQPAASVVRATAVRQEAAAQETAAPVRRASSQGSGARSARTATGGDVREDVSARELDELFARVAEAVNRKVIGQAGFVADLVAAYKQGFMYDRPDRARNVVFLAGASGTGKRTALAALCEELHGQRIASRPTWAEVDLSRYGDSSDWTNFAEDLAAALQGTAVTVLFSGLEKGIHADVVEAVAGLASEGSYRDRAGNRFEAAGKFVVFYADYPIKSGDEPGKIPPELSGRIPAPLFRSVKATALSASLDDRTVARIARQAMDGGAERLSKAMQISIVVDQGAVDALAGKAAAERTFGEAVQAWVYNELAMTLSGLRARDDIRRDERVGIVFENEGYFVEKKDGTRYPIRGIDFLKEESVEDVMKELNALIGLNAVKTSVAELLETVRVNERRAREGGKVVPMALHMAFTGNPGTGKTTVARLVARLLKAMGLLSGGQLVEVARQDLVGEYVGSTAPKTMGKINEALGGVLFVDEAYALSRNEQDSFGREAIDTLVKAMEDHRDDLVVVIAGYSNEIEEFLRSNPGLRSRFPYAIAFEDYEPADMLEMLRRMASGNGFAIEADAGEALVELFGRKQIPGRNDSGNGRLVRNAFESAIRKQASRLGALASGEEADLRTLTAADFEIVPKAAFDIEAALGRVVGLEEVKSFLRTLEKQLLMDRRRKEAGIQADTAQSINMIFAGNPGTGKTTMARLLADMLKAMGYLKQGQLIEADRSDLVAEYVGQTASKTKTVVESALGGVLFIDEAYALAQDGVQGGGFGKEAIDTLVRLIELHKNNLVVVLAGYTDDMKQFLRVNPGLSSRFPLQIEFPDYTPDEMARIAAIMTASRGFELAQDVPDKLKAYFDRKQIPGKKDGGNGRLVRNALEEAIRRQANRLADEASVAADKLNVLAAEDFGLQAGEDHAAQTANALGELDAVIGLDEVKTFVRSLSAQIEVEKRRQQLGLPKVASPALHMVFKGNPGTGKTTIARILARRLRELGVMKSDALVETDRSGLVAGYVGQTALKTKEVIEQALGGVLFIDEAYALAEGDAFGKEAIDTLVKAMDDYRDRLIVILAGYEQDMERFLDRNAGLRSRFPNVITFPDYSAEELLAITRGLLTKQGYRLMPGAEEAIRAVYIDRAGDPTSGNGRMARNLVEKAIRNHALRLSGQADATAEQLSTLAREDFDE